jgi:hypothetical protein
MSYPEGYPRLTFKFQKDENGKLVLGEDGRPKMIYLLRKEDGSGYEELTQEHVGHLMGALENGKDE